MIRAFALAALLGVFPAQAAWALGPVLPPAGTSQPNQAGPAAATPAGPAVPGAGAAPDVDREDAEPPDEENANGDPGGPTPGPGGGAETPAAPGVPDRETLDDSEGLDPTLIPRREPGTMAPNPGEPLYRVDRVVVRGNRKTATSLILGELGLHAGDLLGASDPRVELARIRLLSLGFFLDARLSLEKGDKRGEVSLIVEVEERGTFILNAIHLGTSEATEFWGGVEAAENNLFGRGISLGGGFVASTDPDVSHGQPGVAGRLRLSVPPLGLMGISLSGTGIFVRGSELYRVTGSAGDADPRHFTAASVHRVGGVLGLGHALGRLARLTIDLRAEGVSAELPPVLDRTLPNDSVVPIDFDVRDGFSRVGSMAATFEIDTRSDPLVPRAGMLVSLSVEGSTPDLGSSYRFVKTVLQSSFYKRLWRGHFLGLHAFGGAIFGEAPLFDRFFVGDLNLLLPPRALGLAPSTRSSPDLLGGSLARHRWDDFAGRVLVEYDIPVVRKHGMIYGGDAFVAAGLIGMGSRGAFRDPDRSGFGALPIDLTADVGLRLDTAVGVFTLSIANALGRVTY